MARASKTVKNETAQTETAQTETPVTETQTPATVTETAKTEEAKPVKEPRVTKRGTAILIMKENEGKPMAEVLPLISKALDVNNTAARSYYSWIVENGKGPGVVVKTERTPGEPKKAGEYEVRANSKRAKAIGVMKANEDKAMDVVLPLIMAEIGVDASQARSYYRYLSENGFAPGVVTKKVREPKQAAIKAGTVAAKAAEPTRSPEEIEAAKAANKAKFKELQAAKKKTEAAA
jgi:hypothetical protein